MPQSGPPGGRLFVWPLVAAYLAWWMFKHHTPLRAPRGFGIWLCFIAWSLLSVLVIEAPDRLVAWGYRESLYLSATVILVFGVSVGRRHLPTRWIALAIIWLFGSSVVLACVGLGGARPHHPHTRGAGTAASVVVLAVRGGAGRGPNQCHGGSMPSDRSRPTATPTSGVLRWGCCGPSPCTACSGCAIPSAAPSWCACSRWQWCRRCSRSTGACGSAPWSRPPWCCSGRSRPDGYGS